MPNKKAFTLIELLIIIAIIGILLSAITIGLISARNRAKDASFKTVASNIQTVLTSCCVSSAILTNPITANGTICSPGTEKYPGPEAISGGSVGLCNGGDFTAIINSGTKNRGSYVSATITSNNIIYN